VDTKHSIDSFALTFIGKRQTNQDSCIIVEHGDLQFFAVADGMGGMAGGSIASKKVLQAAKLVLLAIKPDSKKNLKSILKKIFQEADNAIKQTIKDDPLLDGMGTTLCALLCEKNHYVYGNIGDSRIYHLNEKGTRVITEDHTFVEKYLRQFGPPVPPDLKAMSHIIYKAINGEGDEADIFPSDKEYLYLRDGDAFILCSDELVTDDEDMLRHDIHRMVTGLPNLRLACEQLVCEAYYNGSTDNITIVALSYGNFRKTLTHIELDDYPPDGLTVL
jgi:serine/threonine protein phosphatase PrpC